MGCSDRYGHGGRRGNEPLPHGGEGLSCNEIGFGFWEALTAAARNGSAAHPILADALQAAQSGLNHDIPSALERAYDIAVSEFDSELADDVDSALRDYGLGHHPR